MNNIQLYDILNEWNFWNKPISTELTGFDRNNYIKKLLPLLTSREVLILSGARRAGKSTIIYQLIKRLALRGTDISQILYVNFEDYRFAGLLNTDLLEKISDTYFEKVNPLKRPCFFFWDEVQDVENFEKYLRTIYDQKRPIKFIISGSNSKISSGEIADVLTGRNITSNIYPLSFLEYFERKNSCAIQQGEPLEKLYMSLQEQRPLIKNTLDLYIKQGGYPEIVQAFSRNEEYQAGRIITQYFEDIILKDVVKRFELRNTHTVLNLARFCIENTGNLLSYTKIANTLQVNKKMLIDYFDHFEKAFFVFQNRFFSWKVKETIAANKPKKIYMIDHFYKSHMGLQTDIGRVVENIVYLELKNHYNELFYWQGEGEVDFIARAKKAVLAIQVSYSNEIAQRELVPLIECAKTLRTEKLFLITEDVFKKEKVNGVEINFIPLWLFLFADKEAVF